MKPNELLAQVSLAYVGVTEEGGDNKGQIVEKFQKAVDGIASGEPWCMCAIQFWCKEVEKQSGVKSKLFKSESVISTWENTPKIHRRKWPATGLVAIWRMVGTQLGHCGIVIGPLEKESNFFKTVEGNTGPGRGIIRNGDGIYEKIRWLYKSKALPGGMELMGFIDAFPE